MFFLSRCLFSGVLFICLGLGIEEFRQTVAFGNLFPIAQKLENKETVPEAVLDRYERLPQRAVSEGVCRSDILMAAATVVLARLDKKAVDPDESVRTSALFDARRFFQFAVRCSPTNGNYWLRLAMIADALHADRKYVAYLMAQSAHFAPYEQDILIARLYLWNRLDAETIHAAKAIAVQDLRTGLNEADLEPLRSALNPPSENLRDIMLQELAGISDERLFLLSRIGLAPEERGHS
jgi:hypothetical protein